MPVPHIPIFICGARQRLQSIEILCRSRNECILGDPETSTSPLRKRRARTVHFNLTNTVTIAKLLRLALCINIFPLAQCTARKERSHQRQM